MVVPYEQNAEIARYWDNAIDSDTGIKITFETQAAATRTKFHMYKHRKSIEKQCAGEQVFLDAYRIPQMYDLIISQDGPILHIAPPPAPGKVEIL